MQLKIQHELNLEKRAKYPGAKVTVSEREIQGKGGQYILELEKLTNDKNIYTNHNKMDAVRRQQKVLYDLYKDTFNDVSGSARIRRNIEDYFNAVK